jgi:hypothetical protein
VKTLLLFSSSSPPADIQTSVDIWQPNAIDTWQDVNVLDMQLTNGYRTLSSCKDKVDQAGKEGRKLSHVKHVLKRFFSESFTLFTTIVHRKAYQYPHVIWKLFDIAAFCVVVLWDVYKDHKTFFPKASLICLSSYLLKILDSRKTSLG